MKNNYSDLLPITISSKEMTGSETNWFIPADKQKMSQKLRYSNSVIFLLMLATSLSAEGKLVWCGCFLFVKCSLWASSSFRFCCNFHKFSFVFVISYRKLQKSAMRPMASVTKYWMGRIAKKMVLFFVKRSMVDPFPLCKQAKTCCELIFKVQKLKFISETKPHCARNLLNLVLSFFFFVKYLLNWN